MKHFFTKIAASALAFLVLFSTFSFTVEKHYCGDFLVDVSYLGKAERCGMKMDLANVDKNCCKDEVYKIEGQDTLQLSSNIKFDIKNQQFFLSFLLSYNDLYKVFSKKKIEQKKYYPPDIIKDIQVLQEVFII
ncbi:MAG: HYC_CC_PP family protein [Polaribacter sp.]